jgi:TonB family protein
LPVRILSGRKNWAMVRLSASVYSIVNKMKKIISIIILSVIVSFSFAQGIDPQNKKVITNSEPVYPRGDQALYAEVLSNISYPEEAKKKYIEGEVMLSFDVKADSTVSNIIIISGVGNGVDEEVKKYIGKLKFSPAMQNGKVVKMNTMYTFPVKAH